MSEDAHSQPPGRQKLVVGACFDGERFHTAGPYRIAVAEGRIASMTPAPDAAPAFAFALPGLAEGHCHLFLDGEEHDPARRRAQVAASPDEKRKRAVASARKYPAAGVTLAFDLGDASGAALAARDASPADPSLPVVLACGTALHRPGRYGSMIGREVRTEEDVASAVDDACARADAVKVALTGPVNFEEGAVRGAPQFTDAELSEIVQRAAHRGRPVRVHASGAAGIGVAVRAGVGFIEHGYGMTDECLARMRDGRIAWVPTLSPFAALERDPGIAALSGRAADNVCRLLDVHRASVERAFALGVLVVAGSDACSVGVPHGRGLVDELTAMNRAGVGMADVLRSATSLPRSLWGVPGGRIAAGEPADLVLLGASPKGRPDALYDVRAVLCRGRWVAR